MKKSLSLISLGCDKNLVDSEVILGKLLLSRFNTVTQHPEDADVIIINTCCFIDSAIQESESWIERILHLKKENPEKTIMVVGCYVQRYGNQLLQKYPEVDYWIGVNDFPNIAHILTQPIKEKIYTNAEPYLYNESTERLLSTPSHYAFIKITEGCNNCCSYCVIPSIRGKQRSRSIESIQREVTNLVRMGVKELILIGQDVGSYGIDINGKRMLPQLIRALDQILPQGIWIRLLYLSPQSIDNDFIETFVSSEKVCPYLDVPLQHFHPVILEKMKRPSNIDTTLERLSFLRKQISGLILRTTVMVGFPGETDSIFQHMISMIESFRFERLGCFIYSEQPETAASKLSHPVDKTIQKMRYEQVMKTQERIVSNFHQSLIGKSTKVILDSILSSQDQPTFLGRTYGDAPEVDGQITVKIDRNNMY